MLPLANFFVVWLLGLIISIMLVLFYFGLCRSNLVSALTYSLIPLHLRLLFRLVRILLPFFIIYQLLFWRLHLWLVLRIIVMSKILLVQQIRMANLLLLLIINWLPLLFLLFFKLVWIFSAHRIPSYILEIKHVNSFWILSLVLHLFRNRVSLALDVFCCWWFYWFDIL